MNCRQYRVLVQMTSRYLENAIVRLLKQRPFYAQFILNLHRVTVSAPYPLGVTICGGAPTLRINELLFSEFSFYEQEALLEHCVNHLLHLHMSRRKERNNHCWDICCDLAINTTINGMPVYAQLPADYKVAEGLAAEEYYALLVPQFDIGNLSGHGIGKADRDKGGSTGSGESEQVRHGGQVDDHACWQDSDTTPLRLAEEMVRSIAREAHRKSDGEVPGNIRQLVDGFLKPAAIPWQQILSQFVATAGRVGKRSTWQREHRRFLHETPGARKRHRLNLLVGVDVSDSTDILEMREAFARELMGIARNKDSLITVLYANSRIQRIESFSGGNAHAESYHGGGFTDLRPVFEHARTMIPQPAAIIYLTDGYGEAPANMEFPTLWVLTSDGKKPATWGVELRLEV
jgi:predicted metal-dependent peptidase